MSFRITHKDVGRKAVRRNGQIVVVGKDQSIYHPYKAGSDTCNEYGYILDAKRITDQDLFAWVDDQEIGQAHFNDLRDEFAMVAMGAMLDPTFNASLHNSAQTPDNEYLAKWSYDIADAMLKARRGIEN